MKGDETLWVPGTDHAGIATQSVVEKRLAKEGKKRLEMGREAFLGEVWKWKDEYEANIINQIRLTGASTDWTKTRFTLEPKLSNLVEYVFCNLYEKGLLYRGEYMINYSPALETAISDMEVDYKEEEANLYDIIYFVSGSDKELIVSTTRPETLLGDQALAVHPKDKRYKKLIGRKVILPIVNVEIPVIGDESVDMNFGTGVVKVTPAHDASDFAIAKRHDLNTAYQVIDKNGNMTKEAGIFAGLDFMTARENVVELLKAKGNLVKIEPYTHRVGYCSRSGCKIETIISTQWFVKTDKMAKRVLEGYKKKDFTIIPDRYGKVFEDWMKNLRDWCISRQLWWGHQIPAYYHKDTKELLGVTQDPSELYAKYGQENVVRDEDVLDTWFSSALWPFAILDWTPEDQKSELFTKFYPAQVLETGHDILPFWVVRMLLMGYEFTGETPFKQVYLHGLIRDEQGRKMSKSLGNGIDPVDVISQFSADALRLSLSIGNTPGNNMNYSLKTTENYSLFLNKLWNIARFCFGHTEQITTPYEELADTIKKNYDMLLPHEKWILSRLTYVQTRATNALETLNFGETGGDLIAFTRDEFADFFVEEYKLTAEHSPYGKTVLSYTLLTLLRLWHPFIPFVTESLYSRIADDGLLALAPWPTSLCPQDEKIEDEFNTLYELIKGIRFMRGEFRVPPGQKVNVIMIADKKAKAIVETSQVIFV